MTGACELERAYRRWLRCYPREFRREHEEEMLGVLMADARAGQRRPALMQCLDLLRGAACLHLRPRVSRFDRAVVTAVKLMYLGAVVELAAAITILATMGDVRSNVLRSNHDFTAAQWHAVAAGQIAPTAIAAFIAVGFWLWMARSIGRARRRARLAFALFFALNTWGLCNGLASGSAVCARPDLAVGSVVWLVELATITYIFRMRMAGGVPGAGRIISGG